MSGKIEKEKGTDGLQTDVMREKGMRGTVGMKREGREETQEATKEAETMSMMMTEDREGGTGDSSFRKSHDETLYAYEPVQHYTAEIDCCHIHIV